MAPLALVDPYSHQMIVCARPSAASEQEAEDEARAPSKATRVLQFALLASVAVMVVVMLSILQATS